MTKIVTGTGIGRIGRTTGITRSSEYTSLRTVPCVSTGTDPALHQGMADAMALESDPTVTTILAAFLNAAMSRDSSARIAYERLYGAQWSPLGTGAEVNDTASASACTVR